MGACGAECMGRGVRRSFNHFNLIFTLFGGNYGESGGADHAIVHRQPNAVLLRAVRVHAPRADAVKKRGFAV